MMKRDRKLSFFQRMGYGLGGLPIGVIGNGIAFFLLIYYDQVVGLGAGLTALALALALLSDAITDPIVGFISDNTRSRLGRRLPYLFLAPIPAAIFYYLIWHPPSQLSQMGLFYYLLATVIGLRLALTIFDIPHNAINADLTRDYDQRTLLASFKVTFSQYAGYLMVIAMYGVWLVPNDVISDGLLNREGYQQAGAIGAGLIAITMFLSALLLRSKTAEMQDATHDRQLAPGAFFGQVKAAFSIPSLRVILLSAITGAIAYGVLTALWAYVMGYFWQLSTEQTTYILAANFLGAILATASAPLVLANGDKKRRAIMISLISTVFAAAPYLLRFVDLMPANGTGELFWILFAHGVGTVLLWVWSSIITASMTADIVERGIARSGFQNEGIIFSVTTFVGKAGTAGGLVFSGTVLVLAGFPEDLMTELPSESSIRMFGVLYVAITSLLYLVATICLFGYRISRASHDETLDKITSQSLAE